MSTDRGRWLDRDPLQPSAHSVRDDPTRPWTKNGGPTAVPRTVSHHYKYCNPASDVKKTHQSNICTSYIEFIFILIWINLKNKIIFILFYYLFILFEKSLKRHICNIIVISNLNKYLKNNITSKYVQMGGKTTDFFLKTKWYQKNNPILQQVGTYIARQV